MFVLSNSTTLDPTDMWQPKDLEKHWEPEMDDLQVSEHKAMIDCAKHPDARINKCHMTLSFHCVGSLAARGFLATNHTVSGSDAADIVSEHWTHRSAWPLIKPLFNHEGDTCLNDHAAWQFKDTDVTC